MVDMIVLLDNSENKTKTLRITIIARDAWIDLLILGPAVSA